MKECKVLIISDDEGNFIRKCDNTGKYICCKILNGNQMIDYTVFVDNSISLYKWLENEINNGRLTWLSSKSEFKVSTPGIILLNRSIRCMER